MVPLRSAFSGETNLALAISELGGTYPWTIEIEKPSVSALEFAIGSSMGRRVSQLKESCRRFCIEGAHPIRQPYYWFAEFADTGVAQSGIIARLSVHQDGFDDGLHVATNAFAVIIERRRDPGNVLRTGITCHQALYQLFANKWTNVWVIEECVESATLRLASGLLSIEGRNRYTEKFFLEVE